MKTAHKLIGKHVGSIEEPQRLLHETYQNRQDIDVIVPMVRYRQERLVDLNRRDIVMAVFRVLEEEIRRARLLTDFAPDHERLKK